jgi:hypothetical protein
VGKTTWHLDRKNFPYRINLLVPNTKFYTDLLKKWVKGMPLPDEILEDKNLSVFKENFEAKRIVVSEKRDPNKAKRRYVTSTVQTFEQIQ